MIDGIGEQHVNPRAFSDAYFADGCLQNASGHDGVDTPASAVNSNAFFDVARRWSQYIRMLPREQCVGYAVEDGKSILWFRRYAGWGGWGVTRVEIKREGTSPEIFPIEAYRVYEVEAPEGVWVTYNSVDYFDGDRFYGVDGVTEAYPDTGAKLWLLNAGRLGSPAGQDFFDGIADAIAHEAPPSGWTNEWLVGFEWRAYHPSESSLWKPAAYSDYFPFNNRCHFFSPEIAQDAQLRYHFSFGQRLGTYGVVIAESWPGLNYTRIPSTGGRVNTILPGTSACCTTDDDKRNFFRSCRLYEPDVEIDSAESVIENGEELVKLTLTGRLHSTYGESGGAPESIERDMDTWDPDAIAAEPFRTNENALRAYLWHAYRGRNFTRIIGDTAANANPSAVLSDDPYASIYPVVILTKLIPLPRADGNVLQDGQGTPLWHDPFLQMETYLAAMCGGCVDPASTFERNACLVGESDCTHSDLGLYDYTFENLCLAAFGGRWLTTMPSEETDQLYGDDVREDKPHGFGPLPKTPLSSEVFNQFSAAINLLTHYRLDIPFRLEGRYCMYYGDVLSMPSSSADADCGKDNPCMSGTPIGSQHGPWAISVGVPPANTLDACYPESDWEDLTGGILDARTTAALSCGDIDPYLIQAERKVYSYRISLTDADFLHAIPPAWRDLVDIGGSVATLCCLSTDSSWQVPWETDTGCASGSGCHFKQMVQSSVQCVFAVDGDLDTGPNVPSSWYYINDDCNEGAGHYAYLRPLSTVDACLIVPLIDEEMPT